MFFTGIEILQMQKRFMYKTLLSTGLTMCLSIIATMQQERYFTKW